MTAGRGLATRAGDKPAARCRSTVIPASVADVTSGGRAEPLRVTARPGRPSAPRADDGFVALSSAVGSAASDNPTAAATVESEPASAAAPPDGRVARFTPRATPEPMRRSAATPSGAPSSAPAPTLPPVGLGGPTDRALPVPRPRETAPAYPRGTGSPAEFPPPPAASSVAPVPVAPTPPGDSNNSGITAPVAP